MSVAQYRQQLGAILRRQRDGSRAQRQFLFRPRAARTYRGAYLGANGGLLRQASIFLRQRHHARLPRLPARRNRLPVQLQHNRSSIRSMTLPAYPPP